MADKKPTPRGTKIVAGVVFGGMIAIGLGQQYWKWTLESQTNSIIVVLGGAVVGGLIAWLVTREPS